MDLLAYTLRADLAGEVDVERDGQTETVPRFGGAVLAVGDGDFHVADSLALNDGAIVVFTHDQRLVDLLDSYPPLKRTTVPKDPVVVSPYTRRSTEDLRQLASLRDVERFATLSRAKLIDALLAQDAAIHSGDQAAALAVAGAPEDADEIAAETGLDNPTTTEA